MANRGQTFTRIFYTNFDLLITNTDDAFLENGQKKIYLLQRHYFQKRNFHIRN